MNPLTLNSTITVLDVRILTAWRGPSVLELEIDLEPAVAVPSGKVTANIFDQDVIATVDPTGAARFADRVLLRVIGGANGWNQSVKAADFSDDDGVSTKTIITATAKEVGETIAEITDVRMGKTYARSSGVASRVLAGVDWYVDFKGQTHVASRPTAPAPDDVEVLDYDPLTRTLTLGALSSLVLPGMTFTDANGRWEGELTARDVEQRFTADGESIAIAFCGTAQSSMGPRELLERFVAESIRAPYLKTYRYRVVAQESDGRLELQAVTTTPGLPDVLPLEVWAGIPGVSIKFNALAGPIVSVVFLDGDPSRPVVVSHAPGQAPIEIHLDATTLIELGKNAPARASRADRVQTQLDNLVAFAAACGIATNPQVAEIKAAGITLYEALTGSGGGPPPSPPYAPATSTGADIVSIK